MARLVERLAETWALAGGVLLLAIMLVTSVNVAGFGLDRIARVYGASVSGLPGYEDFVSLAISSAALMFLPYCQQKRGHVSVDLFVSAFPAWLQRNLDRSWLILTTAAAAFLAYWMVFGMLEARDDNVLSAVLGWPVWPFYAPGIVSLVLWALVAVIQVFEGYENA